jgi:hypothetical protein
MNYDAPKAFKILSIILTSTDGTTPTQKWRFSAPKTHLWLMKVWFSVSSPK